MFACSNKCRIHEVSTPPTGIAGLRIERPIVMLVVLAGLIAGCGPGPTMEPIPSRNEVEFSCRTTLDGLEIMLDPYTDPDRVKRHFGTNLLSHPYYIVPFEVAFVNKGAKGGFLLRPELAVPVDEGLLEDSRSASPDEVLHSGPGMAPAVTFLFISPAGGGILAALMQEAREDSEDISRHMESLSFADRPLYPSDTNRGFLYLRFARQGDILKAAAVRFCVKNVQSLDEKVVIVSLKRR